MAHEAFLVNWPPLKDEIDAHAAALRARRVVENEAADWAAGGREAGLLLQGGKLTKAMVDTGAEMIRPDGKRRLALPNGLESLALDLGELLLGEFLLEILWRRRPRRLVTHVDLNEVGWEFLAASILAERARRSRRLRQRIQVASVIVCLVLIAFTATGVGFYYQQRSQAQALFRQAVASRLLNEAADMLSQNRPGGDEQALQKLIAAHALAPETTAGALRLAGARGEMIARVWPAGATPQKLCDRLTGNMSPEQWRELISPRIEYINLCPQLPAPPD